MTKAKLKDQPALFEDKAEPKPAAPEKKKPAAAKAPEPAKAPPKRSKKSTPPKPAEKKAVAVAEPKPESKGGAVVPFQPREPRQPTVASVLLTIAKNRDVDPAKARELFAFYQETEAKQQFHDALLTVDLPSINKDGMIEVKEGGAPGKKPLRFASFENVHKTIMPPLRAAGFRLSFQPMPGPNGEGLVVECRLIRGIYEERCVVPISTAPASRAMNSQQATGAAIKYASRYGMMALLNLRSEWIEDADLDGNDPAKVKAKRAKDGALELTATSDAPISEEQAAMLTKALEFAGLAEATFLDKYKLKEIARLPAALFPEALGAIQNWKAAVDAQAKRKAAS